MNIPFDFQFSLLVVKRMSLVFLYIRVIIIAIPVGNVLKKRSISFRMKPTGVL